MKVILVLALAMMSISELKGEKVLLRVQKDQICPPVACKNIDKDKHSSYVAGGNFCYILNSYILLKLIQINI
jgi:hypothetical protein